MSEYLNNEHKKWLLGNLLSKRVYSSNGNYLGTVKNLSIEEVDGDAHLHSIVVAKTTKARVGDLWTDTKIWKATPGFKRRILWKNIKEITDDKIIIRRY